MRILTACVLTVALLGLVGCETTGGGVSAIEKAAITVTGSIVTTAYLDSLSAEKVEDARTAILTGCTLADAVLAGQIEQEMLADVVSKVAEMVPEAYRTLFVSAALSVLKDVDLPTASIGENNVTRLQALVDGVESGATNYTRRDLQRFLRPPPPMKPGMKPPPAVLPKDKIIPT